jgi:putative transposase
MARPLRIEIPGGWYHITARGNERKTPFRTDRDRLHFLELLSELVERFNWRLHSYVLIDNHYHLQVETPEANLSEGMRWLNVSYSVWFNRRHQRVGHLFQGRFKATVVEPESCISKPPGVRSIESSFMEGICGGAGERFAKRSPW